MIAAPLTIFFPKPAVIYADEDYSVKPPAWQTIEKLMASLKANGPLVAVGNMGPDAYDQEPFKLKKGINEVDVWGFKAGAKKAHTPLREVILVGAQKTKTNAFVFYTLAQDITNNKDSLIRGFTPNTTDEKVYVMTYENFKICSLNNLHPIVPFGNVLYSVDATSILRDEKTKEQFKFMGQMIFNHYKSLSNGDSYAGKDALRRICDASKWLGVGGIVRKSHIESAWNLVGDKVCVWQK
jgi:hypothetical protein